MIVAGLAIVAAVAAHDAPLAALGLPPLIVLVVGSALDAPAVANAAEVVISVEPEVVYAGEEITVAVALVSSTADADLVISIPCPPPLVALETLAWSVRARRGERVELTGKICVPVAGRFRLGGAAVAQSGPAGIVVRTLTVETPALEVRPAEQRLRSLPRSSRVRVPAGEQLARSLGDGLELGEIRPQLPGERARRINWRATARRDEIHVTLGHPEQSTDVVLFADTFAEDSLQRVLQTASSAAAAYVRRRDRVGLVCFGGVLDWVEAGSGRHQLDRIRSRLGATTPFYSYAWKTLERIPPRALPTGALVVALSPLRDDRFVAALVEIRARGHEVVAVEVREPAAVLGAGAKASARAAQLLFGMEHEDLLHRLFLRGIPVVPLEPGHPVEEAFSALVELRRHIRLGARR